MVLTFSLAEKWVEVFFDVKRVSDRIIFIKLVAGKSIVVVLLIYVPQAGFDDSVKDVLWKSTMDTNQN